MWFCLKDSTYHIASLSLHFWKSLFMLAELWPTQTVIFLSILNTHTNISISRQHPDDVCPVAISFYFGLCKLLLSLLVSCGLKRMPPHLISYLFHFLILPCELLWDPRITVEQLDCHPKWSTLLLFNVKLPLIKKTEQIRRSGWPCWLAGFWPVYTTTPSCFHLPRLLTLIYFESYHFWYYLPQ